MQHEAYDGLTRRRSISFIDESYFVITDEVRGPATGRLTLRNGLGRGTVERQADGSFIYKDGDAGLQITVEGPEGSTVSIDKDWFSEAMHEKAERPLIRLDATRTPGAGVQRFVTTIKPLKF